MKKTLLSAFMLFGAMGLSQAQTLSPGDETLDVTFNSSSYCLANCCNNTIADLYYASGGNVDAANSKFIAGSHKSFAATSTISAGATPMFVDIYATIGTNCTYARGNAAIDMSNNKKVAITAKTASGTATLQFFLADFELDLTQNGSSTYNINAGGASVIKTINVTSTSQTFLLDYSGDAAFGTWAGRSHVDMYGIIITAGASADIQISDITFGSTMVLSNTSANVVNDQVSLYPNPAKGQFSVDMTAMNNSESAFVKVMNANGVVVKEFTSNNAMEVITTEGLNRGIYMVQITSGNKIATKKVVVE